eukprot:2209870-Alexandrium_andersonii.AAC.1
MARALLGNDVACRGSECSRSAQRQSGCAPPPRRALAPRGAPRHSVGPPGGRVGVCGQRPATGDPARPAGGCCAAPAASG